LLLIQKQFDPQKEKKRKTSSPIKIWPKETQCQKQFDSPNLTKERFPHENTVKDTNFSHSFFLTGSHIISWEIR
jgi:hypothetical protein